MKGAKKGSKINRNSVAKILSSYGLKKDDGGIGELKALDKKVKRPAAVFAVVFGSLAAIVMGSGMSLSITDLAVSLGIQGTLFIITGVIIGVIGRGYAPAVFRIKTVLSFHKEGKVLCF